MTYRVAFEGASGEEHTVEVDASSGDEAVATAKAQYDPLHLAQSCRVLEEPKGSYFNRSFVITPSKG